MTYDYDLYTPTNTVGIGVWGVNSCYIGYSRRISSIFCISK